MRGTLLRILERSDNAPLHFHFGNFDRPRATHQAYFEALEQLRNHFEPLRATIDKMVHFVELPMRLRQLQNGGW